MTSLSSSGAQTEKDLFLQIQSAIKEKKFSLAETLRQQLLARFPMALTEIIKAANLIDAGRAEGIDGDHLAIWDRLYTMLSTEEKNCLYYSLKQAVVPPGKVILAYGTLNTRLFFIDSGEVTIYRPDGNKHTVLAQLVSGDILGEYTFTTISLCSATAVSHTEVHLRYLENSATDSWEQQHPGLYDKLTDFCLRFGRVDEIINQKKLEKRTHTRYQASGRVSATVLSAAGKMTAITFRGSLSDLSVTGGCFLIKFSKKATARALLTRYLSLTLTLGQDEATPCFSAIGMVVAVSFQLYNEYCVHVKFINPLDEEVVLKVARPNDGEESY